METENAKSQAKAQFNCIVDIMEAIRKANDTEDYEDQERREEEARENALSVEIRSGWCFSREDMKPEEFKILLCTGGPAVQIVGDCDNGQPEFPVLQYQDWGTPWIDYPLSDEQKDILTEYCGLFYFSE